MEFLWGHFVITAIIGLLLLARSKRAKPAGRLFRLTYPWTIKLLGAFGFAAISTGLFVGFRDSTDDRWSFLAIGGAMWTITFAGLVHCFGFKIMFAEEFIYASSPWSRVKTVAWQDIVSVTRGDGQHIIHDIHGHVFAINNYLNGAKQLVALATHCASTNSCNGSEA
jgi:hypothetical protein